MTPTLTHYSDIVSGIPSGSHASLHILWHSFWHIFWHSFWHSICYIFEDSFQLRSGGDHSDPELAVWVRRGTLRSSACSWGPAEEKEKEELEEVGAADIKSNNPHLTGGEEGKDVWHLLSTSMRGFRRILSWNQITPWFNLMDPEFLNYPHSQKAVSWIFVNMFAISSFGNNTEKDAVAHHIWPLCKAGGQHVRYFPWALLVAFYWHPSEPICQASRMLRNHEIHELQLWTSFSKPRNVPTNYKKSGNKIDTFAKKEPSSPLGPPKQ